MGLNKRKIFRKYYTCVHCGKPICGDKRTFFACPNCGSAICSKYDVKDCQNYCGNCGYDLSSAIKLALEMNAQEKM